LAKFELIDRGILLVSSYCIFLYYLKTDKISVSKQKDVII